MREKDKEGKDASSVHSKEDSGHGEEVEVVGGGEGVHEPFTDPDGWVYGDNKWENQSNKGGISKYTRFRRWTRIAVLTEFVQVVDAAEDASCNARATKRRATSVSTSTAQAAGSNRDTSPSALRRSTLPPMNLSKEGAAPHISTPVTASPVSSSATANAASDSHSSKAETSASEEQAIAVNTQPTPSALMSPPHSAADTKSPTHGARAVADGHDKGEKMDSPLRQRLRNALNK
ncbi:hypothetical protein NMY22_g4819 [Coprinellus aureogranulatus]|nr:hypothetical protein NMY22_g4819 [Coprinellus aureogranulatus]